MTAAITYAPGEFLRFLHRRRGPLVRFGAGSYRYAYLLGPEANRFVFANDDLFTMREAFEGLVPVDGETSLIVSDGDDHRRRRRLVQPSMHHRQVDQYVAIMTESADEAIDRWRPGDVVDAYQVFRAAIRRSTLRALFGARLAEDADVLGEHLQALLDLVDRSPDVIRLHRRLRTPLWQRVMRARARVDVRIHEEIDRVREAGAAADDRVLAMLVNGQGEDGGLSDEEVRDQAVTLIAAGYETTSAAMAWAIHLLVTHPAARERAAASPPYLRAVVAETLRLYPPAVVSARHVARAFEFAGRTVTAGTILLYSPYVTHRSPAVFDDPLAFRPERWLPDEPAYRRIRPYEFIPFGGGPHRCIGATMATTELTVMLGRLLERTELRAVRQRIRPTGFAAMRPRHGLRVAVSRVG
ncbi:cytochrome P450 [Actinophytocola sp.]|uniref:cytochrome P450 n=1 Tax=Actinophytocola sp. TaxID=1872138 RepID=UPI003D6AF8A4